MKVRLIWVGRTVRGPVSDCLREYLDRLARTMVVEEVVVPEAGTGAPAYQQRVEGERLLAALLDLPACQDLGFLKEVAHDHA